MGFELKLNIVVCAVNVADDMNALAMNLQPDCWNVITDKARCCQCKGTMTKLRTQACTLLNRSVRQTSCSMYTGAHRVVGHNIKT